MLRTVLRIRLDSASRGEIFMAVDLAIYHSFVFAGEVYGVDIAYIIYLV